MQGRLGENTKITHLILTFFPGGFLSFYVEWAFLWVASLKDRRRRLLLPGQPGKLATGKKVTRLLELMKKISRALLQLCRNAITLGLTEGPLREEKIGD